MLVDFCDHVRAKPIGAQLTMPKTETGLVLQDTITNLEMALEDLRIMQNLGLLLE